MQTGNNYKQIEKYKKMNYVGKFLKKMKRVYSIWILLIIALVTIVSSCKDKEREFSEPYGPAIERLGIRISTSEAPIPAQGLPGDVVTVNATGLLEFKDELIFRFNGEVADVQEVTETGIKVVVPDYASTGVTSVSVGDVVVFGPIFNVIGLISVDPTFRAPNGANGAVRNVLRTEDDKNIFVGSFTNYDNKGTLRPINRIVRTFQDGGYDASLLSGRGANGTINDIVRFGDKYMIAGSFTGYDQRTENISRLTMLNLNGSIDTIPMDTYRNPDQDDTTKYFSRFNGGTDGSISRIYPKGNKLLVTGNFRYHISRQYDQPSIDELRDTVILDSTEIRQFALLNEDGSLDKSYRFNPTTDMGLPGANGNIGTIMHTEGSLAGKMLVFGSFTRFDDIQKGYITRLNPDGTIDNSFNANGAGTDFNINTANYNPVTRKYLITGNFTTYNGESSRWMALLNEDGTHDPSFVPREIVGGGVGFAKQLNDGLIVVSGNFRTYGGVARNGFMVLDSKGDLAVGYNATGIFRGDLIDAIETLSEDGRRALLLIGSFSRFNNDPVNNIIRLIISE